MEGGKPEVDKRLQFIFAAWGASCVCRRVALHSLCAARGIGQAEKCVAIAPCTHTHMHTNTHAQQQTALSTDLASPAALHLAGQRVHWRGVLPHMPHTGALFTGYLSQFCHASLVFKLSQRAVKCAGRGAMHFKNRKCKAKKG